MTPSTIPSINPTPEFDIKAEPIPARAPTMWKQRIVHHLTNEIKCNQYATTTSKKWKYANYATGAFLSLGACFLEKSFPNFYAAQKIMYYTFLGVAGSIAGLAIGFFAVKIDENLKSFDREARELKKALRHFKNEDDGFIDIFYRALLQKRTPEEISSLNLDIVLKEYSSFEWQELRKLVIEGLDLKFQLLRSISNMHG